VRADLVVLAIGGVQRFIAQSRKTEDAAGGSWLIRDLVVAAAHEVNQRLADVPEPLGLVFPVPAALSASGHLGVTSKVVALVPETTGPDVAAAAVRALRERWRAMVHLARWQDGVRHDDLPGAPDVVWACVTGDPDNYPDIWKRAQAALVNRRRARVFQPLAWRDSTLCAQTPSLPAQPPPTNSLRVEREPKAEALSAVGWIKRLYGRQEAHEEQLGTFPSTTVIASSTLRQRLLNAAAVDPAVYGRLAELAGEFEAVLDSFQDTRRPHRRLPGGVAPALQAFSDRLGTLVNPDEWEFDALSADYGAENVRSEMVERGKRAALNTQKLARELGIATLTPYYAVIVQDLDRLGRAIGGFDVATQRRASGALRDLAVAQQELLAGTLAVPIYAGGDDFLAFSPAADALTIAAHLRTAIRDRPADPLTDVTASTAVVFAHMTDGLRDTIATAQSALKKAKNARGLGGRQRDALSVVVLRRGGERARTILPWYPPVAGGRTPATDLLAAITPGQAGFSARLAARLEADQAHLDSLAASSDWWRVLQRELNRLVARQGGTPEIAAALYALAVDERSRPGRSFQPVPAALVARFLAQECTGGVEQRAAVLS
jgi:CRISPR-associated protein